MLQFSSKTLANIRYSPTELTKTAGGITKMPTSQSATARLITKRFVTVRSRLVVMTDKITKVFPIIVITINKQNSTVRTIFVHGQFSASTLLSSVSFIFNHEGCEPHKLITLVLRWARICLRTCCTKRISESLSYGNLSVVFSGTCHLEQHPLQIHKQVGWIG